MLIHAGADVNAVHAVDRLPGYGNAGQSALHIAVDCGKSGLHEHPCALLLRHGAHVNAVDNVGMTPLMSACNNGMEEAFSILLTTPDVALDVQCATTRVRGFTENLPFSSDYEDNNFFSKLRGKTALLLSVSRGYFAMALRLIEAGANDKILDFENNSALDILQAKFPHQASADSLRSVLRLSLS